MTDPNVHPSETFDPNANDEVIYYDPNDPNDPNAPQNYYGDEFDSNAAPEYPGYEGWGYDPQTGAFIDPQTGTYVNPATGYAIDPDTGYSIDPISGDFIDPETGQTFTAEEAREANERYAAEDAAARENLDQYYGGFGDPEEQEVDAAEYIDIDRAVKFAKPEGRQKRQSTFSGNEMRIMFLERLDERIRRKNWILLFLSLIGILLMIIHVLVNWDSERLEIDGDSGSAVALKFGIGFSTVMAVCALFDYYQLEVYVWRKYYSQNSEEAVEYGWPISFLIPFLVEAAVLLVHPVPYLSDDKVGLLMFMRLYLVVRLVRDSSSLYHERHTIADKAYHDRGGPEFNWVLILRITFEQRPGTCLTCLFALTSLVCGFCNYICARESVEIEPDYNFIKATWGSAMLLTTGMSKQAATSNWSRMVEVITLIIGTLLFAMVLAVIHNTLLLRPKDQYGLKCIASINREEQLKKNSAVLIQNWWRLLRMESKNRVTTQDYLDFSSVCTRHKRTRQRLRTQEKSSLDPTFDQMLNLEKHFYEIKKDVSDIKIAQHLMRTRASEIAVLFKGNKTA